MSANRRVHRGASWLALCTPAASPCADDQRAARVVERALEPVENAPGPPGPMPVTRRRSSTTYSTPSSAVEHAPVQELGRAEEQVALQLEDGDRVAEPRRSASYSTVGRCRLDRTLVHRYERRTTDRTTGWKRNGCSEYSAARRWHTLIARTLLPRASRRGENTPMPNWPGSTATMPPETPLLAGRPTVKAHSPA